MAWLRGKKTEIILDRCKCIRSEVNGGAGATEEVEAASLANRNNNWYFDKEIEDDLKKIKKYYTNNDKNKQNRWNIECETTHKKERKKKQAVNK